MAQASIQPEPTVHAPSWAATGAALAALSALYINGKHYPGVFVIGLLLVAVHLVRFRMTRNVVAVWLVRIAVMFAIVMTTGRRRSTGSAWFLDPDYVSLFGFLCAGELLVQVWQRRSRSAPHGEILLLTCLMMIAGSNTFERDHLQVIVPLFTVLLAFSLRAFRTRAATPPQARVPVFSLRWAAVFVALCIGFGTALALHEYGQRVTIFPLSSIFRRAGVNATIAVSPSPILSTTFNLQPSPTRVLLVEGTLPEAHLRGASFYRYRDHGWDPPSDERRTERVPADRLERDAAGKRLRFTRLVPDLDMLYVPLNSASVSAEGSVLEWEVDDGRSLQSVGTIIGRYSYEVVLGRTPDHQGPLCVPLDESARRKYLDVPEHVRAVVAPIAAAHVTSADPPQRIAQVVRYLQSNHKYSLTLQQVPDEVDPLVDFLSNRRDAHCQFFASAAVMMLRAAGVPARLVSGYYAHEQGGPGMVVRQHDAHAWTEAYLDGTGWITVDATPAGGRPDQLFGPLTSRWDRFREWMRDFAQQPWMVIRSLPWKRILLVAAVPFAAWLAMKVLRKVRLRRVLPRPAHNYLYPENELAEIARGFEQVLRRRGLPPPGNRTWREHVARLRTGSAQAMSGLDSRALEQFLLAYDVARFGAGVNEQVMSALHELLRRIDGRAASSAG